jgi:hypothetical protein
MPCLRAATAPTRPKEKVKEPVPTRADAPLTGLRSNKNFVTTNAVEVILSQVC